MSVSFHNDVPASHPHEDILAVMVKGIPSVKNPLIADNLKPGLKMYAVCCLAIQESGLWGWVELDKDWKEYFGDYLLACNRQDVWVYVTGATPAYYEPSRTPQPPVKKMTWRSA